MRKYFQDIVMGAWSLAVGMWITLRHAFRRPVTVQYPYQVLKMPSRYRGHIELTRDESTGLPKCIVCMACQRACPSNCIALDGAKPEGGTRKALTRYTLDFTTCSLCGLCVESCTFDAIHFSKDYNLASPRKEDYVMDMLKRCQEKR
jgi:NADH-quinone oxidoreductase subunit I